MSHKEIPKYIYKICGNVNEIIMIFETREEMMQSLSLSNRVVSVYFLICAKSHRVNDVDMHFLVYRIVAHTFNQ